MTPQDQQQQIQQIGGKEAVREQDKVFLILSYLGCLSLIPLLTVKDSPFVKFHAKQGLVLLGLGIGVGILSVVPFIGWILGCVGSVGILVFAVMGIVKALNGERWRIPVVGDLADKINL